MRIVAKLVPRLLQNEQKKHSLEVCRELQHQVREDPNFLPKVVTGFIRLLSFPQDDNQVEGRRFDTVEKIQAETQIALNILKEEHSRIHFKRGRDAGIGVRSPKGTT
jgi:hypothetical protein